MIKTESPENVLNLKKNSDYSSSSNNKDEILLEELELCSCYDELKAILSKINRESPSFHAVLKGKYHISVMDDLFKWQKPFGELLQNAIVICGAKPRKMSEAECNYDEVFSDDSGSPLPVQFESLLLVNSGESLTHSVMKYLQESHVLYPLSQNVGRRLLYMCNSIDCESLRNLPILIICHGKNPNAAIFQGSWKQNKNSRFCVINQGSISKQEKLPRLSVLKENHLRGFPPSFSDVETSVFTRYDLMPVKEASLYMECSWSKSLAILEPLTNDCTCFVKVKAVDGNCESVTFPMYKEIKLIEALHQSLQSGMMTWSNSDTNKNVLQKVQEFINSEKSNLFNNGKSAVPVVESQLCDLATALEQVINGHIHLDFTERLWNILKDCSSTEELIEAFTLVYNALGDFLARPFVYQKNTSTVALTVKNMMEKLILCPILNAELALKLLLEMGVEKLKRDYRTIFLSLELIPLECLSYYLQPELLSFEAVTCLRKLQSVLELAIMCEKNLSLSKELLSSFIRNTLKYYSTVPDIDFEHVFDFEIPILKARQLLNPMRPTIWEISLLSCVNGYKKQSIHHFQTTPVHEHIYSPKNYDPKLMLKTASYVYFSATLVQDDFFTQEE